MVKKAGLILLICTALVGFVVSVLKKEEKPKVVVVLKRLDVEYWKIFKSGAEQAFEDFGLDGKVIAPKSVYPPTNEADLLKKILSQKPDALIVTPIHPSITTPVLMEYKKRNIPVLFAGRDAEWKDKTSYIGTSHSLLGKKAGELLSSMLQPGDQVALIYGSLEDRAVRERLMGVKAVLEDAGIDIAAEHRGEDQFGNPLPVTEHILQVYPNIKGVFATNDLIALEALEVIRDQELDISVVGTDGILKMVKSIEEGALSATVGQNPYDMGYLSVVQARKAVNGESVEKRIDSGVEIITEDNRKEKLAFLARVLQ